jgi:hypothetical protein
LRRQVWTLKSWWPARDGTTHKCIRKCSSPCFRSVVDVIWLKITITSHGGGWDCSFKLFFLLRYWYADGFTYLAEYTRSYSPDTWR